MDYELGDVIVSRKQHACGEGKWEITRTGADYRLKCLKCGRNIFLSPDELKKMTKKIIRERNDNA